MNGYKLTVRKAFLMLVLLSINACLGTAPVVVSFPETSSLIRTESEFLINGSEVSVSAGVKVLGKATDLSIIINPSRGVINNFRLLLNNNEINYSINQSNGYYFISTGLNLTNNDLLTVNFNVNLGFGTHLLTIDFTSNESSHHIESALRVDDNLNGLITQESSWMQFNAFVGRLVAWALMVNATNPNEMLVESLINASLIPDSVNIQLISDNNDLPFFTEGLIIYWRDTLTALEKKRYIITLFTPPVIESSQSLSVIDSINDSLLLSNEVTLSNIAKINYHNVTYDFNVNFDKVLNVSCSECNYYEFNNALRVVFNEIKALSTEKLLINYFDNPPLLSVNVNTIGFKTNSSVSLTINLIPNNDIHGLNLELEVLNPQGDLVFADLISYNEVRVNELLNKTVNFNLVNAMEGNYTVIVNAREGLRLTAYSKEWFLIQNRSLSNITLSIIVVLIINLLVWLPILKRFR